METLFKDSKIKVGDEEWIVKYYPQVLHPKTNKYLKAARIPSKKEIWLSVNDASGKKFEIEDITANFQKAILPIIVEDKKKEFGKETVNKALQNLGKNV